MNAPSPTQLRSFSFTSREYVDTPHAYCRAFLQSHPVFYTEADDCFVVSRFDHAKNILSDYETFSSDSGVLQKRVDRPDDYGFAPIFMLSPPMQTRLRKLSAPAFSASSSQELEADIVGDARRLLEKHSGRPAIEIVDEYATPLAINAMVALLGVRGELAKHLYALIRDVTIRPDYTQSEDTSFLKGDDKATGLKRLIAEHYRSVKAGNACPFAARLTAPDKEGDRLSDNEAFGMLYLSSIAGVEDAIRSIASVLVALAQNEAAKEAVCGDIDGQIPNAVLEALRLYPSSHFVRRTTTRDVAIGGVEIPSGSNVVACIAAANRDAAQFKDPDTFDLARGNVKSALTFGAGPHVCIGKHIGKTIVTAAVAEFLRRYPDYQLDLATADKTSRGMIQGYRRLVALKEAATEYAIDEACSVARP